MASQVDMPLDSFVKSKKFVGPKRGGFGGYRMSVSENGAPVTDLRSVLAKKQAANITDLRAKLKPKALYTSKLSSRAKQPAQQQVSNGKDSGRKPLKLTPSFKNSVSSAVSSSSGSSSKSSRGSRSGSESHRRSRSSSYKLPSYEEAKKISVTVPGLSRPMSEYSSHRREERLAAQIARSKDLRQDSYMRGREEFLASAITSAVGGVAIGGGGGGGSHGHERERERERERDRSMGMFGRMPPQVSHKRGYPSRSPSPPMPEYGSYDPLYPLGGGFHHTKAPPPPTFPSGGNRQRGITTATSMIISNLSDTVSKNDVAELCSVVGSLDGVYMHAPGIAEVVFKYKDDALEAFKKYNQRNLDGQPMHCKLQPASRSRLAAAPPGGYGHSYADDFYPPHGGSGFY